MNAKISQFILLLIFATQAVSTFAAEDKSYGKQKKYHGRQKPKQHQSHHRSNHHSKRHQKPENPLGPGAHYCENSHFDSGRGCPNPGRCPEDPKSPNYRYRK